MDPRRTLVPLAILALAVGAVAALSAPPRRGRARSDTEPLLPRKELVRALGRPVLHLVADYYWLQTTYQAGIASDAPQSRDIYPYAEMVTDLDPLFAPCYRLAGVAIPYNLGREQWVNVDEANALLRKGIERFPRDVFLHILLGFNLSNYQHKPKEAAAVLQQVAGLPNAPRYLGHLATRLYSEGGDIESGIALATSLRDASADPDDRAALDRRILELMLEARMREVDRATAQFQAAHNRLPSSVEELVGAHLLPGVPVDPFGGKIVIGEDGLARSTAESHRLQIHDPGARNR